MKYFVLVCVVAVALLSSACKYQNTEDLFPNLTCDTTAMNYAKINKILTDNTCMGCHSASTYSASGGGNNLGTYEDLKTFALDSSLYKSVAHLPGASEMPKGGGKLTDCDIAKIGRWMANGAPE